MNPVLNLPSPSLFICVLVAVGTWCALLLFRSLDSSSTNNEDSKRRTQQVNKEIEDHTREKYALSDKIRAQEEELQKSKERERRLKKKIEELEEECDRMKESSFRWGPELKRRKEELRVERAKLKDLQDTNSDLEEELKLQRQRHDVELRTIARLEKEKKKLEVYAMRLDGDQKKLGSITSVLIKDTRVASGINYFSTNVANNDLSRYFIDIRE